MSISLSNPFTLLLVAGVVYLFMKNNMVTSRVLAEAVICAIALIVVVHIVSFLLSKTTTLKPSLPEICATWNQNYVMEITLAISAILLHILFEYTGVNLAYKQGAPIPFLGV